MTTAQMNSSRSGLSIISSTASQTANAMLNQATTFSFVVPDYFTTPSNTLEYNTSVDEYQNVSEFATITLTQLLTKNFNLSSFAATETTTFSVPSISGNDSFLSTRNRSFLACTSHLPSVQQYLAAINVVGLTIFSLGILAVLLILYMYMDTTKHVIKYAPPLAKTHSAFVLSVYPVVAVAVYCAIVVPRAHLLAEAMTNGMFMAALYQLFCLFIAYSGGEAELIKRVRPEVLVMKVPPCCCWPCCLLPTLAITKTNIQRLRLLVLQLPVVQGLVYMVLLVMWAEEESLYQVNYVYMQPVIIISILCGIWGVIMTMTMLNEVLEQHNIRAKFLVLQLVLMLAKLQGLIARLAAWQHWLPCKMPITPTVYANLIYNSAMLWEMVLLMYFAQKFYKQPAPDLSVTKMKRSQIEVNIVLPSSAYTYDEKNNNDVRRY